MSTPNRQIPQNVVDAMRRGQFLEAIKLLRAAGGISPQAPKGMVDQHRPAAAVRAPHAPAPNATASAFGMTPAPVSQAIQQGNKLEAIRLLRMHQGLGLKEAHDAVEALIRDAAVKAGRLSPGEVPRPGSGVRLVLVALAVIAGWYFLRQGG